MNINCSYREFQLRNSIPNVISEDLEEMMIHAKNYEEFYRLAQSAFPLSGIESSVFSDYKAMNVFPFNDKELTRLGLHVFRKYFAYIAHKKRVVNEMSYFDNEGLAIFEQLFNDEYISPAIEEFQNIPLSVNKQFGNIILADTNRYPTLTLLANSLKFMIERCIGSEPKFEIEEKFNTNTFAQRVMNSPNDNDNQKNSHVDTFFPAIKWWWFPKAVTLDDGPLCYARNSPKMVDSMLDWVYSESIKCVEGTYDKSKLIDHVQGSLRATDEELTALGYEMKPVPVDGNTLVIANVSGFHRRGDTANTYIRNAIHGSIRLSNPFHF